MKITEICFTCSGHAIVAARHDRAREGVRRVWVVDELDDQIRAAVPAGVEVWVVPFNRRGNLNGWECIEGQLGVYRRAFVEGAEAVIKRDSDTIIHDDAAMTDLPEGEVALFVNRGVSPRWKVWGAGYTLLPGALPIIADAVRYRDWFQDNPPEDLFISFALRRDGVSRILPLQACRFQWEGGWPEYRVKLWTNAHNRMDASNRTNVWWRGWPDRTK